MGLKKGLFITCEGGEGSGKSTNIRFAFRLLKKAGKKVILLRDPGTSKIGEDIRRILLNKKNNRMAVETELFLFLAARAQMVKESIEPALKKGFVVLCDRYEDSTVVYQGYAGGYPLKRLRKMIALTGHVQPDITFLFDVPVSLGLKRAGRTDRRNGNP